MLRCELVGLHRLNIISKICRRETYYYESVTMASKVVLPVLTLHPFW